MTDEVIRQDIHQSKSRSSSRALSILLALAADAFLVWLLFLRHNNLQLPEGAETFWTYVFLGFVAYSVIQLWTLAYQTGRGNELAATVDKLTAASPALVAALIEVYWAGSGALATLNWRQHLVAAAWGVFAIADFFSTDITNQRLRVRQMNIGQSD